MLDERQDSKTGIERLEIMSEVAPDILASDKACLLRVLRWFYIRESNVVCYGRKNRLSL